MNKNRLKNEFSVIQCLRITHSKLGLKRENMTLPYSHQKAKVVAGHPTLIPKGGYTVEGLDSNSSRSLCKSKCILKALKRSSRFCIYCLSFDNEADCPETAYTTYESFPRILYHPQDVKVLAYCTQKEGNPKCLHSFFTKNS